MNLLMFRTVFTTAGQETRSTANIPLQATCLFQLHFQCPLDASVITKASEYVGKMLHRMSVPIYGTRNKIHFTAKENTAQSMAVTWRALEMRPLSPRELCEGNLEGAPLLMTRKDMLSTALEMGVCFHRGPAFGEHGGTLLS